MILANLKIADVLRYNRDDRIIAIEGHDGCGKTTLCVELVKKSSFHFVEIPEAYMTQPFKNYLYSQTSSISSALIFAASLVDRMSFIKKSPSFIFYLQDRSLWSTVAINWVKDTGHAQEIINIFASIHPYIPLPGHIFILDVSFEICMERIRRRPEILRKFDITRKKEFMRNLDFYNWLCTQNVGAELIPADDKNPSQLCKVILDKLGQEM